MATAVIYARYSSAGQNDASIEQQVHECREYAERNGYTILDVYEDHALTGRTDERPAFQRMIADSAKRTFQYVITFTVDRFSRNRFDSAVYKSRLKKNGVQVIYVQTVIPDGPEGIILESVLEGYAEYFSANLGAHTKRGLADAARKHLAIHAAPFGYMVDTERHYVPNPAQVDALRYIYTEYANGARAQDIMQWLNDNGYRTAYGKPFAKTSLVTILKNEMYIGTYSFGDVKEENAIPAVIDRDIFDRVQEKLAFNRKNRSHFKPDDLFILTGKLFCGECGSPMIGDSGTSKNGTVHYYYKCADRKRGNGCKKKPCRKRELEDCVIRAVMREVLTDDVIEKLADLTAALFEEEAKANDHTEDLRRQLEEVGVQKKRIVKFIMMQDDPDQELNDALKELTEKQRKLEKAMEKEQYAKRKYPTKEDIVVWLHSFVNGDIANEHFRQRIASELVNAVYVYDSPEGGGHRIDIVVNTEKGKKKKCSATTGSTTLHPLSPNISVCSGFCFIQGIRL